ncbi:MAG TPA: DUF503 domain-containing protein [bacterium]|mgnify:CR=1 FL=1|nr:DUF503 domain-containing protein [bacterium]HQO34172.1 DUF503 domain-containing protein [bacterium]HQP98095.1 DUF503 domain-containing protein [bacterium]
MTYLGLLEIAIRIPGSDSLKAKRHVLRSLKDRIRGQFNVSFAEIDEMSIWQRADLAASAVAASQHRVEEILHRVLRIIENNPDVEVLESHIELF